MSMCANFFFFPLARKKEIALVYYFTGHQEKHVIFNPRIGTQKIWHSKVAQCFIMTVTSEKYFFL